MSSSPSRAANLPPTLRSGKNEPLEVSPFPYGEARASPGQRSFPLVEHRASGLGESNPPAPADRGAQHDAQQHESGRRQGAAECRAKFEEQLAGERVALAEALKGFARERAAYYQKLEEEAVQLAMSIARKVVHRESQVDPLLLMGIVRVALEKIEGATGVSLLVHPERVLDWRQYLASRMDAGDLPEIVEDAAMRLEQCVLRTSMGTAELGLESQLKEIEQGLMDLLAARPQGKG